MTKTIMIVDDEKDIITSLTKILRSEGYGVISAASGAECLAKLAETKPDLVLLDFFMPGMSGRAVLEKIRENKKLADLKVALFTVAEIRKSGIEQFASLNICDYISKPADTADLLKRVKRIVGE